MAQPEAAAKQAKQKNGNPDCTDPEGKCPPKENNDPYKVKRGQLTFDAEGQEGGRYHSRHAHWPGGASGVTLGRGYDMGGRTSASVYSDLVDAGVPSNVAHQYAAGAGKKGAAAGRWVNANRDGIPDISPEAQNRLFDKTYAEQEAVVKRISDKSDAVKKYGAVCWDNLDPKIRDSLIDLKYRGDYTPRTRRFLQKAAADNDPEAFGKAMRNRANWGSVPADRLNRRVNYWE